MSEKPIQLDYLPDLKDPLFIAGFDGWGNALDMSRGMVDFLIQKLNAKVFGKLNPDFFYRFDENRPVVNIKNGLLQSIFPPGGFFYATPEGFANRDVILLKATEPNLRWFEFVDSILTLCQETGVKTIISIGAMYDNVLHTDTVISVLASSEKLIAGLKEKKVLTVNYKGPGAIHSFIQDASHKRGFESMSFWCHCPYYLQGTTHFGLLSQLGHLLSSIGNFTLDTKDLDTTWKELGQRIQELIDKNPELQEMINDLRKAKIKGSWEEAGKHNKVIHLEDFLKPR